MQRKGSDQMPPELQMFTFIGLFDQSHNGRMVCWSEKAFCAGRKNLLLLDSQLILIQTKAVHLSFMNWVTAELH